MATENLTLIIQQRGARTVQKQLGSIGNSALASDKRVGGLNKTLGALVAIQIGRKLANTADAFTTLSNRTKVFASSGADAQLRLEGIVAIAIKSRAPLDATATIFQRLSLAQKSTGLETQELLDVTETLTKALAISGATGQEAEGALRQLAQGIAANRLSGQEFNSVIEQTPRIALAISDSLGVVVGDLRKLANEGKLTSRVVIEAFQAQAGAIEEEFKLLAPTIGQAFTVLSTAVTVFIGKIDVATASSSLFAVGVINIAKGILSASTNVENSIRNFETLAIIFSTLIAIKVVGFLKTVRLQLILLNRTAITLALSNPFTAFIAVAGFAIAAAFRFRKSLIEVGEQKFRLTEVAGVLLDKVKPAIESTAKALTGIDFEFPSAEQAFNDLVAGFNIIARVGFAAAKVVVEAFKNLGSSVVKVFKSIPDILKALVKDDFEGAGKIIGKAFKLGLTDEIDGFGAEVEKIVSEETGTKAFEFIRNAANDSDILTEATKRTTAAIKEEAEAAKAAKEAADAARDRDTSGDNSVSIGLSSKSLDKLRKQVNDLDGELNESKAIIQEYDERVALLGQAYEAHVITLEEFVRLQGESNTVMQEGLDELNFEKLENFTAATTGAQAGFTSFAESLGGQAGIMATGIENAFNQATDAMIEFASTGEFSLRGFAQSAIKLIQSVIVKLFVLKAIQLATGTAASLGGSGGNGLPSASAFDTFTSQAANGAQVARGNTFLVGERGPELFTASKSGSIIPNELLGGGASKPQVNVQVVNVTDPNSIPEALGTAAGEEAVLNIVRTNSDILRETG